MSYGLFGGFAEGLTTGRNLRMKEDALEDEKKTNQLKRDSLELEIQKQKTSLEDAERNRNITEYSALEGDRIRREGANYKPLSFDDFVAQKKAKAPPKPEPKPEQPTGMAGIVAGIRNAISPSPAAAAPAAPAGIAAPAAAPVGIAAPAASEGPTPEAAPAPAGIRSPAGEQPQQPQGDQEKPLNYLLPAGHESPTARAQAIRNQSDLLQRVLMLKGDTKGAMEVPKVMKELLAQNWDETVGMSSTAAMNGLRPGLKSLLKMSEVLPLGYTGDGDSGTWDPKTNTWKGVIVTNAETGKQEAMDLDQGFFIGIAKKFDLPGATLAIIENRNKDTKNKIEQQKADADTKGADAKMISANADASKAATLARAQTTKEQDDIKQRDADSTQKFADRRFPWAGKSIGLKEEMELGGGSEKEVAAKKAKLQATIDFQTAASEVYNGGRGLNPKVPLPVMASFAEQAVRGALSKDVEKDAKGNAFLTFGNYKIALPDGYEAFIQSVNKKGAK